VVLLPARVSAGDTSSSQQRPLPEPNDRELAVVTHLVAPMPERDRLHVTRATNRAVGPLHDRVRLALRGAARAATGGPGVRLHAAACRLPGSLGLLLPGRTGTGKSTLVAALAHLRGAGVVADDSVRVWRGSAVGNGTPIVVRSGSPMWPVARGLWYADDGDRVVVRPDDIGGTVEYETTIDVIVVPRFGEPCSLAQLSPASSFAWMCSMLLAPATDDDLAELAVQAAAVPSYTMGYDSFDGGLGAVDEVATVVGSWRRGGSPRVLRRDETDGITGAVWGARFDDEVVLVNRSTNQAVHLAEWPDGSSVTLPSWSRLVGSSGVER
jgi:hypothetical protein